jgi:hypothetical protein
MTATARQPHGTPSPAGPYSPAVPVKPSARAWNCPCKPPPCARGCSSLRSVRDPLSSDTQVRPVPDRRELLPRGLIICRSKSASADFEHRLCGCRHGSVSSLGGKRRARLSAPRRRRGRFPSASATRPKVMSYRDGLVDRISRSTTSPCRCVGSRPRPGARFRRSRAAHRWLGFRSWPRGSPGPCGSACGVRLPAQRIP